VLNFLPPIVIANAALSDSLRLAPVWCYQDFARVCRVGIGVERFNCRMGGETGYRSCSVGIAKVQIYSPRESPES
jgi:hypothetical protein